MSLQGQIESQHFNVNHKCYYRSILDANVMPLGNEHDALVPDSSPKRTYIQLNFTNKTMICAFSHHQYRPSIIKLDLNYFH